MSRYPGDVRHLAVAVGVLVPEDVVAGLLVPEGVLCRQYY